MKLRHPWLIAWAAFLLSLAAWCYMRTMRYRFVLPRAPVHPNDPSLHQRFIYAIWHENLLFTAGVRFRGKISVLISQHADGELVARVCRHLGYATVRGSSTRGGARALRELLQRGRAGHLVITPDGPRGPRRRVQLGAVYIASRTGLAIVPVGIGYQRAWRVRSWDRFAIPWPGTTAVAVAGEPLQVPPDLDRHQLEQYRLRLEQALAEASARAERLAQGDNRGDAEKPRGALRRVA